MILNFAELKKRLQPKSVLALTLESGRIAASVVRRENNGGGAPLSIPFGCEEVLKNPETVGSELLLALGAAGIRERRCVVCVPPTWALTASIDLPEVGSEDLRGYLELRAEREFSIPISDLRFAYSSYVLPDGKHRATLAAISPKRIEALEKMIEAAGCRALSISLALDGCLSGSRAMLHLLAAGDAVDVIVTGGGGIMGLRSLPGPSKAAETAFDPEGFCREIRITLGRMPEAMRRQVVRARFGGIPAAAQALCLEVRDRLQRMGIECPGCEKIIEKKAGGAAVESAECFLREQPLAFEFVTPETNRFEEVFQRFDSEGRRKMVAVGVGVLLLLILAVLIRSHTESSLAREWDGMKRNVAELDALQQKIRYFRPWFEPTPQGVQVLESLVSAFPEGGEVWAKSVQIGEGYKITCTGFARNQAAWLGLLDRLKGRPDVTGLQVQQVRGGGDNQVQFSVTYKWEPRHEG